MKKRIIILSTLSILMLTTGCGSNPASVSYNPPSTNVTVSTSAPVETKTEAATETTTEAPTVTTEEVNQETTTEQAAVEVIDSQDETVNTENEGFEDEFPDYSYLSEDMLIGSWSPDIDEEQPNIMEFYYNSNGQLCYYYYTLVPKDGFSLMREGNIARMEYTHGHVSTLMNQASCSCLAKDDMTSEHSYYLTELDKGIITDQFDGKQMYKVSDDRLSSGIYAFDDIPPED